jgi:hypothetical protein
MHVILDDPDLDDAAVMAFGDFRECPPEEVGDA